MSRLAKKPIIIPANITASIDDAGEVTIKGPKGELKRAFKTKVIGIEIKDNEMHFIKHKDDVFSRSLWGTYAAHVRNMIAGVTDGFVKKLQLEGVGYRWSATAKAVEMSVGFSHSVSLEIPQGVDVAVEKNTLTVSGIDKEAVGAFAAKIRAVKKPEPYKGKGIRYEGEYVPRKQGKRGV